MCGDIATEAHLSLRGGLQLGDGLIVTAITSLGSLLPVAAFARCGTVCLRHRICLHVASFQSTAVSAFVDGGLSTAQSLSVGLAGVSGSLNVGEFARTTMSLSTGREVVFLWQQRFHLLICPAGFQPVRFR